MKTNLCTLLLLTSTISIVHAEEEKNLIEKTYQDVKDLNETGLYRPHFALLSGISDPIEHGYETSEFVAIEAGYQLKVPYGVGFEVSTQELQNDDEPDITRTQFFMKSSYNFSGELPVIKYSYIGLGLGLVAENSNNEVTYGAIMPNLGFDIPLERFSEKISFGANLRYTSTASNEADNYGLNGVVKYWF